MIEFEPLAHTYTNTETNEKYISVTTLIGKYEPAFDAPLVAGRISKRDGIPVDIILDTWEQIKNAACKKGSMIHDMMERYIKDGTRNNNISWLYTEYDRIIKEQIWRYNKVHSEMLLYDHDYKVAGMADIVIDSGQYFYIVDFKTNKEFGFECKYGDYFFEPLEHLPVCEFNAYCLQLSMYAYMYSRLTGKKLKKMFILYLRPDIKSFDVIHLNYMMTEVHSLMDHYKHNYCR
jgi:hypothetical protein